MVRALVCSALLGLFGHVCACTAYDAALLGMNAEGGCGDGRVESGEECDSAIPRGEPGACPTRCAGEGVCAPAVLLGDGCLRRCVVQPIEVAHHEDGCCPDGVSASDDVDCALCGDGLIGQGETCDPPGTCLAPANCASQNACIVGTVTGAPESCDVRCELSSVVACEDDDDCCPAGCDAGNDDDCSLACGDGIVDAKTETCEPTSASDPCPESCDDGDACTEDHATGSAFNCNYDCSHSSILLPRAGDGCCPRTADAQNDSDCIAECGNGIIEPGEECDGGLDCGLDCRGGGAMGCQPIEAETQGGAAGQTCSACACANCVDQAAACGASPIEARQVACIAAIDCTRRTGCSDDQCYCGSARGCLIPDGPCVAEFESAAGSRSPALVVACANNPACLAYPAFAHARCMTDACSAACAQ
jgi:hypothetical protein